MAKANSDHVRKATSNKAWHAKWSRRVADMIATYRKAWENEPFSKVLSKLFLEEWDTPMPASSGVCFLDVFLDAQWNVAPKSRDNNCYLKLNYNYVFETAMRDDPELDLEDIRRRLRLFLESVYFDNSHAYQLKLCFMHAAFKKVCASKMIFAIGSGGDGKGMEAILDRALFGDLASATLDCGVFLDRAEFRKSARFAWNMATVRIQEMDQKGHFHADIWKRFVVGEDIDCRVNYGFTSKRRFGESMKIQELNYDHIPVIEEARDRTKCCQQLQRRVACVRMGKGRFVVDPAEVDVENGIFLLIPQDELAAFLSSPITAAIYLREYCVPFFKETSLEEALQMINDVGSIHPDLQRDTLWLASRLSGGTAPPPGEDFENVDEFNNIVVAAHTHTPCRRVVKEYLIQKVESLPGAVASSRGKRTKLSYLIEALDHSDMKLLHQVEYGCFHKLLIDWQKLQACMDLPGGRDVFGSWEEWGDIFGFLRLQEKWSGACFDAQAVAIRKHKINNEDMAARARPHGLRFLRLRYPCIVQSR